MRECGNRWFLGNFSYFSRFLTFAEFEKEKNKAECRKRAEKQKNQSGNHSPNNDTGILRQSLDNHDGFVPRERKEPIRGLLHPD